MDRVKPTHLECKVDPDCALVVRAVGTMHVAVHDGCLSHAGIADDEHLQRVNVRLTRMGQIMCVCVCALVGRLTHACTPTNHEGDGPSGLHGHADTDTVARVLSKSPEHGMEI